MTRMHRLLLFLSPVLAAGCAAPANYSLAPSQVPEPWPLEERSEEMWESGRGLMQGFIGSSFFERVSIEDSSSSSPVDGDEGELDQLPLLGGGGQWKLGGKRVDLGLEGLLGLSGRADAEAFAIGGGGAVVAVDVDLLLIDIYGGPFASMFLGDKLRVYAAAGPLFQFADYDQSGNGLSDDGSGFGTGFYARTGIEFVLKSRMMIGVGARWSDSSIDLSGGLGDLEIEGLQALITFSQGI